MSSKTRLLFFAAAAAGATLAWGSMASAQNVVLDSSFEANAPAAGTFFQPFDSYGAPPTNWAYVDGPAGDGKGAPDDGGWEESNSLAGGQFQGYNFTPDTPDGSAHWVTLRDSEALYQDLGTTVQNNVTGNYSFSQGNQYNSPAAGVTISLWGGVPGAVGSVELDSFDSPPDGASDPTVLAETVTGTLNTGILGAGKELYLEMQQDGTGFFNDPGSTNGNNVLIDDVTLSLTAVPEPASLGILAMGGMMLIRRRRRVQ